MLHVSLEDLLSQLTDQVGLSREAAGSLVDSLDRTICRESDEAVSMNSVIVPPIVNERNALRKVGELRARLSRTPALQMQGRGIVVCAGGARMLRCAWVCIGMLRRTGCPLPVELWHLNEAEVKAEVRQLFRIMEVKFVNAEDMRRMHPVRILRAWELKPYALLHSSFEEVLLLDADNVPLHNPAALFSAEPYLNTGTVFWPDGEPLSAANPLWQILRLSPSLHPAFESGQIVLHKKKCWKELNLTVFLNEHSDFFYSYVHGDKDTFHLAWRLLDRPYTIMPFPMVRLPGTMCQHDFYGRRLFQHRNFFKWDREARVEGFSRENVCWQLLHEYDDAMLSA